ncbi:MAG: hypothetical protein JJT94_17275 [Bernardetiaceae bacterium]|nr:hypothetical protein [Bernardetiaceae bacterium]
MDTKIIIILIIILITTACKQESEKKEVLQVEISYTQNELDSLSFKWKEDSASSLGYRKRENAYLMFAMLRNIYDKVDSSKVIRYFGCPDIRNKYISENTKRISYQYCVALENPCYSYISLHLDAGKDSVIYMHQFIH